MVRYDKSVIYKICCKDVNVTGEYIGSTTNLQRRKAQHKGCCINVNDKKHNLNVYSYIRGNGGWDAFDMVEIERYVATDKAHLHARERHWIETLKSELNGRIPTRTSKEYYEDNKEYVTEKNKKWYEANRDSVNKRQTKKVTCECGLVLSCNNLPVHKRTKKHISFIQTSSPIQI